MSSVGKRGPDVPKAAGRPSESGFGARGGWWVAAQSVLMVGVILAGAFQGGRWHSLATYAAGWVLFVLGGGLGIAGVLHLGEARTAFPRPIEQRQLVTSGVYGWVRHPLYTSVILASLGWGLIGSSWIALVLAVVLAVFLDAKSRYEERWLREAYPGYQSYAQRVRRMVPWVY